MERIFLHIGYPKTGSSAIQTSFLASREELSGADIFFPNVHAGLCNAVAARFYQRFRSLFPYCDMQIDEPAIQRCIDQDFAQMDQAIQTSECSVGVLSSESLIGLDPNSILHLRDWLLTRARVVTVVCYVRNPPSFAASVIQERVKWGERIPLPACNLPIARFEHQLPYWEEAFGRENMIVRSASKEDLILQDVVADFADVIGYRGKLDRYREYQNESISHVAVLLLDALNDLDNRIVSSNLAFQDIWKLPGEKYWISLDLFESVKVQSRPHLQYLYEHWGIRFQEKMSANDETTMFSKETARGLAGFIAELHKQARSSEPSPFRERW